MKIKFIETKELRDPKTHKVIQTFEKDAIIETHPEVAAHWIEIGAAIAIADQSASEAEVSPPPAPPAPPAPDHLAAPVASSSDEEPSAPMFKRPRR